MNSNQGHLPPMRHHKLQTGGALLVAMVMIFMLSIMGVSAMRSSTLNKRMTANAIQSSVTFQAAESASNLALNQTTNLNTAINAGVGEEVHIEITNIQSDIGLQTESTLELVDTGGLVPGSSEGVFQGAWFVARGIASIDSVRSQSTVEQGAYQLIPADLKD